MVLWVSVLNQVTEMKNTSITLGEHFDQYITDQLASGRYRTASELIREGLRLHEERELKLAALKAAIEEGVASGLASEFSFDQLNQELDTLMAK